MKGYLSAHEGRFPTGQGAAGLGELFPYLPYLRLKDDKEVEISPDIFTENHSSYAYVASGLNENELDCVIPVIFEKPWNRKLIRVLLSDVENVIFRNNKVWDGGAGLFLSRCSSMVIVNVLFDGNDATSGNGINNPNMPPNGKRWGGALFAEATSAELINCTFSSNNAADSGSGITVDSSTLHIVNSIFDRVEFLRLGNPITHPSSLHFEYCDTWQCSRRPTSWSLQYDNSIHHNPNFSSSFHLQQGSPCIDSGNNNFVPGDVLWDLGLQPRIFNGTVDMGAYELQ